LIPVQDMLYLRNEEEARRYLAASRPPDTLADYPFIAAEVGITAATPSGLASLWLTMAAQLAQIGSVIKTLRLGALARIEAARSPGATRAVVAVFKTGVAEVIGLAQPGGDVP
jgi:hypothetical protein